MFLINAHGKLCLADNAQQYPVGRFGNPSGSSYQSRIPGWAESSCFPLRLLLWEPCSEKKCATPLHRHPEVCGNISEWYGLLNRNKSIIASLPCPQQFHAVCGLLGKWLWFPSSIPGQIISNLKIRLSAIVVCGGFLCCCKCWCWCKDLWVGFFCILHGVLSYSSQPLHS